MCAPVCVRSGHVHQTWIFYTNSLHTPCVSWYDVSILQTLCVLSFCTVCVAVLHDNSDYTVVYALISMLWCLMLPHLIPSYLILFHLISSYLISSHLILLHLHMLMRFKHLWCCLCPPDFLGIAGYIMISTGAVFLAVAVILTVCTLKCRGKTNFLFCQTVIHFLLKFKRQH